jgi:leucyl-tRNA synthetase
MTYGTGAIMAVPAHDQRDYEFAKMFNIPIVEVIAGGNIEAEAYTDSANGVAINSPLIEGLKGRDAINAMNDIIEEMGIGKRKVNFKLRDWCFHASVIGANRFRWFTANTADGCRFRKKNYRSGCPTLRTTSRPTTANRRWRICPTGTRHEMSQMRRGCKARDRYHAAVGGIQLVFSAL